MSKKREDWTMREWRDYYDGLRARAEDNYQQSGVPKYERDRLKYEVIVDAFNGYLENKAETDTEKTRRQRNIDYYFERFLGRDSFTLAEVKNIVQTIREF